jgi:hypothetical protein
MHGVLNHPTIVNASFKRKIFLYDKGDYESYRNILSVVDWDGIFRNDDIDIITNTITNTILDAANKIIPNRYITFIFSEILSKYDCFAFNISLLHLLRIFRNFSHDVPDSIGVSKIYLSMYV